MRIGCFIFLLISGYPAKITERDGYAWTILDLSPTVKALLIVSLCGIIVTLLRSDIPQIIERGSYALYVFHLLINLQALQIKRLGCFIVSLVQGQCTCPIQRLRPFLRPPCCPFAP